MRYVTPATLILVAIIHLMPLVGVLGSERLEALYGITVDEPNLLILMRHRAVLFGILGTFMVVAAWTPALRTAAFAMGFASVVSFLWLAWSTGGSNAEIGRVVAVDVAALFLLLLGLVAHIHSMIAVSGFRNQNPTK
ncbi:MAG: phosphopantetheine adenylyltransferase [bacterium]|nr:phosphopantetheine adenylyltransferase [bacterium]